MDQAKFDAMALDWWKRPADQGGAGGLGTVVAITNLLNKVANKEDVTQAEIDSLRGGLVKLGAPAV